MIKNTNRNTWILTQLANFSMINFGLIVTIQGASFLAVMNYMKIQPVQMGNIMFLNALGFLIMRFFTGILSDLFNRKQIILLGAFFSAIALFLFGATPNYYVNLILVTILGMGNSLWFGTLNATIVDLYQDDLGRAMNKLHFFFTIGGIIGPILVAWILGHSFQWQIAYRIAASAKIVFIYARLNRVSA